MLVRGFSFGNAMPALRLHTAAALAVAAILAGCQFVPDFAREPRETADLRDGSVVEPKAEEAGPASGAAASDEAVTLDRAAARRLQAQLAELGFAPGPVDGIVGPRTRRAIERYQQANRLPPTGEISPRLLKHLETASARREAEARAPISPGREDVPTYQPGTTFVYSNGQVDRVSGTESATVQWARSDGTTYTASRNFLLPWSSWASDTQRGTATVSEAADALWPRREGAEVAFSAEVIVQRRDDPDSTEKRVDQWRCRNGGRRNVTVRAGTFETLVFVCRRGAAPESPELVRTWYYANSVRHFVRFVESDRERDTIRTVDLVAIRPGAPNWPPIVRAALARALVHALESEEEEPRMVWTSSGVDTHVTIEATAQFIAPSGRPCRRFMQIWSENGRHWQYPAMACKTAQGQWQIPGLESNTANLVASSRETS